MGPNGGADDDRQRLNGRPISLKVSNRLWRQPLVVGSQHLKARAVRKEKYFMPFKFLNNGSLFFFNHEIVEDFA